MLLIMSLVWFQNPMAKNYSKIQIEHFIISTVSETPEVCSAFNLIDYPCLPPIFESDGNFPNTSKEFLLINFIVTQASKELLLKMGNCNFAFYRAIAVFGLHRFPDDKDCLLTLDTLSLDNEEVLYCRPKRGSVNSCDSLSISLLFKEKYIKTYSTPSKYLNELDVGSSELIEIDLDKILNQRKD